MREESSESQARIALAAVEYIYIHRRPSGFSHVEFRKMKKALMDKGYLCKNVHYDGIEDRGNLPFVYLNHKFFKDNQVLLKGTFEGIHDFIEIDCIVNQRIEDEVRTLKVRSSPIGLPESLLKLLRSLPKAKLLAYCGTQSELKEGMTDLADFFGTIKTALLAEYYSDAFVEICTNKPLEIGRECCLLAGNGFTMAIVEDGPSKYDRGAVLKRAFGMRIPQLAVSGANMEVDFQEVITDVNSIVASENQVELEERLKRGSIHYFKELVSRLDNRYIEQANMILMLRCQERYHMNQISGRSASYEFSIWDFSFEELLYLFEAFGLTVASDDTDAQLDRFVRASRRIPIYRRILGLALFNDGDSVKKSIVKRDRKGRFLASVRIGFYLTTNYDAFCEHFFDCQVSHLHGSFLHYVGEDGTVKMHNAQDYDAIVKSVQDCDEHHICLGLPKDSEMFATELDQLKLVRGTLLIHGFSGDYDNHISRRVAENSNIENIVYFKHGLEDEIKAGHEQMVKSEVLWKFSRMRKPVTIVDSDRFFE